MQTKNRPQFPLYIVSKGRWESRITNRHLFAMGIPHYIVVEEQELENYRAHVQGAELLVLDPEYKRRYELCDDLGLSKSTGSGPARNFAWEHARANGFPYYWVMDDNINGFFRFNHNLKTPAVTGAVFNAMESFVQRYTNIAMAGPQYFMFVSRKTVLPAYVANTRIYSCNLIRTDLPFRWRGRYNEDVILSLDLLKAGWCTVLFNAFLQYKMPTQSVAGGNTTELYGSGTLVKSEMLARVHPDVARTTFKFGRDHHHVDYSAWKDRPLKRRPDFVLPDGVDNWGMVLQQRVGDSWVRIDKPKSEPKRAKYAPSIVSEGAA